MQVTVNGRDINTGLLQTNEDCRGCNKCLNGCPVLSANVAVEDEGGMNKIYVDQQRCILCGRCMDLCGHDARVFVDDTGRFFDDLAGAAAGKRKGISLVVAPAFIINYPQKYKMVLGYLKHLGVNHIYSVSAGADITIWGYINYLNQNGGKGLIAQPCPAIVNYVEMYRPQLMERMMPVHSPMMCAAIYLKKYLGLEDDIAFLGPCIAKKGEIDRPENHQYIEYSLTFEHLMKALSGVDLSTFSASDSEIDYGMGAMFSMHGGMRENLEYYLGLDADAYINQKEGETYSYDYLDLYAGKVDYDDPYRAKVIDILNCARGCNYGTATEFKHTPSNHIPYSMNRIRVEKNKGVRPEEALDLATPAERLAALNKRFEGLVLEDFMAHYTDRSLPQPHISRTRIQQIFKKMLKVTQAEQTMDCSSCGHRSCAEMATAIALGYNYRENCMHYVKKKLIIEHSEVVLQKQKYELLQNAKESDLPAHMDQLTGLGNRYGFEQALEKAVRQGHKSGATGTLFMLDLDDFKDINESYGADFGNSLLMEFAAFLQDNLGQEAELFRVGGDEFAVLLPGAGETAAREVRETLMRRTQRAWEILGTRFYCTASIGTTHYPFADDSYSDIIKSAELAMFTAKQRGKNTCVEYSPELKQKTGDQVSMIRQMRDSVANDFEGFHVMFHPWVHADGTILGAEALLRWRDEAGNSVSPGSFIPTAESTGLIGPMGEFVLQEAAMACKKLNEAMPEFIMSVNVSAKQFVKADIYDRFFEILGKSNVNRRNMVLEVTESLSIESQAGRRAVFDRFVEQGINIALDDFGTGYSSLSYLKDLPLDLVKIDRSFVKNIETDTYSQYVLSMIAELMHKMGRRVCVEGVENARQLDFCKRYEVDIIQGYYFYQPMPLEELLKLVKLQMEE